MADPATSPPLTRASVLAARDLIAGHVHRTPTLGSATLSALASTPRDDGLLVQLVGPGTNADAEEEKQQHNHEFARPRMRLWLKCENFQRVGAFKARGAFHALERLRREPGFVEGGGLERGVCTHSSGNHAQALALAARELGMPAHIVMPEVSAPPKIAATRDTYGARVVFSGSASDEREAAAAAVVAATGARLVPPYDHPDIMLGQGTLGLELCEDAAPLISSAAAAAAESADGKKSGDTKENEEEKEKEKKKEKKTHLDAILAPCGGGGMLSGVALSCEGTPTRVYGCEPREGGADDAKRGYEAGSRVESVRSMTVADGLRTPLGAYPWSVIYERRLVSGFFSVSEAEIRAALRLVLERAKLVVEPSAAVAVAVALFSEEFRRLVEREAPASPGGVWDVGVVLTGGNVALDALGSLFPKPAQAPA